MNIEKDKGPLSIVGMVKGNRAIMRLSQSELADRAGVHTETINALENKGHIPKPITLMKICNVLDINKAQMGRAYKKAVTKRAGDKWDSLTKGEEE